jgi:predicted Zn-dependent protease
MRKEFVSSRPAISKIFAITRTGVALLLFVFVARIWALGDANLSGLLEGARTDYLAGNFDVALRELDQHDKAKGPDGDSLDLRGAIAVEQNKLESAERDFTEAHKLQPELFAPRLHLADLFLREKKYDAARELYEKLGAETNIVLSSEQVRYGLLIVALASHADAAAQSALARITFPTESPAYYFAQAASALAHNDANEGKKWMATARAIFEPRAVAWFIRPLYNLGWLKDEPRPPSL